MDSAQNNTIQRYIWVPSKAWQINGFMTAEQALRTTCQTSKKVAVEAYL